MATFFGVLALLLAVNALLLLFSVNGGSVAKRPNTLRQDQHVYNPRRMKNTLRLPFLMTICLFLFFGASFAQQGKLDRAGKKYGQLAFIDASKIYLNVAESGHKSVDLFKKLGNTFYFNANYEDASKWYGELFALTEQIDPVYYIRYSQSLKAIGNEEESSKWFDKYLQRVGVADKRYKNTTDYLEIIEENSNRYRMEHLSLNTEGMDFGATVHDGHLIFSSTRDSGAVFKRRSAWDGLSFLDLFESELKEDGTFGKPKKLKGDINTRGHESTAIYTKDGKTMYFTRSNNTPRIKLTKTDAQQLKIYRAHLVAGKWTDVEDLSINGDTYSTAHPALGPAENKLYFVSDMPTSIGQTDIYVVRINADGSLGKPVNLGERINTKGRESFPFVTDDNELYFSSDGHFGLGGYDVFYTQLGNSSFGTLINVGKPINSSFDDVAFVMGNDKKGFVSSNRPGGNGFDDIYGFIETKDIKEILKSRIHGIVVDKQTKAPLRNARIEILDEDNKRVVELRTDSKGYYEEKVDISKNYNIRASLQHYDGDHAYSHKGTEDREHNFELSRNAIGVGEGDDLAKILNIIIYFDLDRSHIRPDAAVELEKIVAAMKQHPNLKINIGSHTDSRASDSYNRALSERRARATVDYLVKKGIQRTRLSGRGYGESKLLNNCANGVPCSEREHQLNRRSEFIIMQ